MAEAKDQVQETIAYIDGVCDDYSKLNEMRARLEQTNESNPNEPQILWRLARCLYDLSERQADVEVKKALLTAGHEHAKKAIEIDPNCGPGHKWFGITLSETSEFEGNKAKILAAYTIREAFDKAAAASPQDPLCWHLLGRWCFSIASIGWLERRVASALLASPPESTYEEALQFFLRAEEVKPRQLIENCYYIAKTYYQLSNRAKQTEWLRITAEMEPRGPADAKLRDEARAQL
eukprot:TRINITY_DN822_c0_g2_i1.p1 TRINITY_DN822_c0_g2~~TRINITY_DN822_c0_g2_i1.p1  ORF type:complete len:235 (-),score=82.27 TRINITY_DN822_c0_g2_i1:61-765(-)